MTGRPRKGARATSPFWRAVDAALSARAAGQSPGPRTLADLARALGISPAQITHYRVGRREMPAHIEAAIRATLPGVP